MALLTANTGDVFEVKMMGLIEGQQTVNIWHFAQVGDGDEDVLLHLVQVLLNCFTTHLLPVLSSSWRLDEIRTKQVYPIHGAEVITVPNVNTQGGGSDAALPSYCAAVVSKRTAFGGRSKRGRHYWAGIPEDQTTGSFIENTQPLWTALLAFAACVISEFVHPDPAGGHAIYDMMLYSRKLGGSQLPLGQAGLTAVREYVPTRALGTMRSRKVGRGS